MTWFWFIAFLLMLAWNACLMRMLHIAQHDLRAARRRDQVAALRRTGPGTSPRADLDEIRGVIFPVQRDGGDR